MRTSRLGLVSFVVLVALSAYVALAAPAPKLLGISWVAFVAMAGAAYFGARTTAEHPHGLVWAYGLASGAMITSAAVFLVPAAIDHHAAFGGFGIALGILSGFGAHTIGHRLSHLDMPLDHTAAALSAHALAAGSIIGMVYTAMPELGPLLGLSIVSHKGPAGYVAARRMVRNGKPVSAMLLPAAGVGITALTVSLFHPPALAIVRAVVFGFAAGLFLHVAMDFLPSCEVGGDVSEVVALTGDAHSLLDSLRVHAVASTGIGGVAVFAAWALLVA